MGRAGPCQGQVLEGWGQVILLHTKGKLSGDGRFHLGIWRQPPPQLHCIACDYGIFSNFPQDLREQLFLVIEPFGLPASLQDVQFPFVSGFVVGFCVFLGGLLLQKQIGTWRLEAWRYIECEPPYTVKKKNITFQNWFTFRNKPRKHRNDPRKWLLFCIIETKEKNWNKISNDFSEEGSVFFLSLFLNKILEKLLQFCKAQTELWFSISKYPFRVSRQLKSSSLWFAQCSSQ